MRRALPVAAVAAIGSAVLTACTGSAPATTVSAGPSASDPACAAVVKSAPATVLNAPRVEARTPVPGVAQWGSPAIVLRCGVPPTGPTTLGCLTVNDVDWVVDPAADPIRFLTYGRQPAVEVLVPLKYGRENATGALVDVEPVVKPLPQSHRCIGESDLTATPASSATPAASATTSP